MLTNYHYLKNQCRIIYKYKRLISNTSNYSIYIQVYLVNSNYLTPSMYSIVC